MYSEEYKKETYELWGSPTDEMCFARQRLEEQGVESFDEHNYAPNKNLASEFYRKAIEQATEHNKKVAIYFESGVIKGLFVVSPDEKRNFDNLCKNQAFLREDKPIPQQIAHTGRQGTSR